MYAYAAGGGSSRSPRIFVSYVHQDEKLCRKLLAHLRVLERRRGIDVWHYKKIVPGDDWQGAIHQELARADVILLLLSPELVDSDYCWDVEVSRALERQRKNEARVIPVLLRPVAAWQKTPVGRLHALPRNGKPVSEWRNRDEAFILAKWYRQSPLAEPLRRAGFLDSNDTGRFQLNVIKDEPAQIREVTSGCCAMASGVSPAPPTIEPATRSCGGSTWPGESILWPIRLIESLWSG